MNPAIFQLPFVQVALPIVFAVFLASYVNNKRLDDLRSDFNRRFDEVIRRLERIEGKLDNHEVRIVKIEAETALVKR